MMDEMVIRVLASMRTSWARDAYVLHHVGRCLEDVPERAPLLQISWQGTKLLDVSEKMKSAVQMVTEVIAALNVNTPAEVRGDSIHSDETPEWEPLESDHRR